MPITEVPPRPTEPSGVCGSFFYGACPTCERRLHNAQAAWDAQYGGDALITHWLAEGSDEDPPDDVPPAWACAYCAESDVTPFRPGHDLCAPCARRVVRCDHCRNYTTMTTTAYVLAFGQFCETCQTNVGATECDNCGTLYAPAYGGCCWDEEDEEDEEDTAGIHDYSYRPVPQFHGDEGAPMFGVELEVETDSGSLVDAAETARRWLGSLVYLKHDSSLEHGFEIVTHPMSLAYAQANDWSGLDELRKMGVTSWDPATTGMHVHVGRESFRGDSHAWRFAQLFARNADPMQAVAGRKCAEWASFGPALRDNIRRHCVEKAYPLERYTAVNMQNDATIEVRIFRGTLNVSHFLANIELVAAAVEYTRHLTSKNVIDFALAWAEFTHYVLGARSSYPNLANLIVRKVTY